MTLVTVINKNLNTLIPIIYEFKEDVKKHILIYDEARLEKELASKLKKGIKQLLKVKIELLKIDEDSKSDMLKIKEKLDKEEMIYLNATDGDISLVVVISSYILNRNGFVVAWSDRFVAYFKSFVLVTWILLLCY